MKPFITTLKVSLWMLVLSIFNTACTDNDFNEITTDQQGDAIQVVISGPDNYAVSRAAGETKLLFENDDRIHVAIEFTLDGNTIQKKYACLKYVKTDQKWEEAGTSNFKWPWNAISASFTAYFIPSAGNYKNNSQLNNNGTVTLPLSELSKNNLDPLKATYTDVPAGGAVYLQFEHLLTKVTLTALDGITTNSQLRMSLPELTDQWSIKLEGNELKESFTQANSFIESTCTDDRQVMFLLPPVDAGTKLQLAKRDMSPLHSIQLPTDQALKAGKHYTIDTKNLPDNFIADDLKEQDWGKEEAIKLTPEEIGKYLIGVSVGDDTNGKVFTVERSGKIIDILISYTEGNNRTVIQVRDVDFQGGTFAPPAEVSQTVIFNGNGHYIRNVSLTNVTGNDKAIFGLNRGSMSNLNIETVTSTTSTETNLGILVARNSGTLDNIHIKGAITLDAGSNARYIGALTGWNDGTITNCSITGEGEMAINVNHTISETVNVGGLTGYSQKGISDCKIEKTGKISVSGESTYTTFIGGFIGNHITNGTIEECLTNLNLDITKTHNIYAGGFIGQGTRALAHCTATGTLTFGNIADDNVQNVNIGGFIGMMDSSNNPASLLDCAFTGSLTGTFPSGAHAGGLAGAISTKENAKIDRSFAAGTLPESNVAGLVGYINPDNTAAATVSNSFCIEGSPFVASTGTDKCTITSCHINGKVPGTENGFTPDAENTSYWRNTPPIYGDGIYYLIRGTK